MSTINWSKAPDWAHSVGKVRSFQHLCWLGDELYGYVGREPEHYDLAKHSGSIGHRSLDEFEIVERRPKEFQGIPAIGSTVLIVKSPTLPVWPQAEQFIGANCTLHAVFMTGDVLMVAVEHQEEFICCCFRAEMVRTPEQVAAEERTKAIDELVRATCIDRGDAARIYDYGYRKQVAP